MQEMNNVTPILPAAASESGRENFYFYRCQRVGHCRAYAMCLSLIDRVEEGVSMNADYAPCAASIKSRLCPALAMREEERLSGQAIYFKSRPVPLETTIVYEKFVVAQSAQRVEVISTPKANTASGSYADAINNYLDSINHEGKSLEQPEQ